MRFKVGDIVIGKPEAKFHYAITAEGWIGQVTNVRLLAHENEISVTQYDTMHDMQVKGARSYWVSSKYFEFYSSNMYSE